MFCVDFITVRCFREENGGKKLSVKYSTVETLLGLEN